MKRWMKDGMIVGRNRAERAQRLESVKETGRWPELPEERNSGTGEGLLIWRFAAQAQVTISVDY